MRTLAARFVVAIGVVVAGCAGSGTPTPPPATLKPVPVETVAPTAGPTPTVDPCSDPGALDVWLVIHGIEGVLALELVSGDPGPAATINPFILEATDLLLGGATEVELRVNLGGTDVEGVTLNEIFADFVPFEATASEPVAATIDGASATLQLPSRDVSGILRMSATWTTSCGLGSGGGKLGLKLLDPTVAAGCPTTSDGLLEQVVGLQATTLKVGTLQVPIGIVGWTGRWVDASAIDDYPQFSGWDQAVVTSVAAGENLPVKDVLDGTDFTLLRFAFYRRTDVVAYLEGSLDEISSVDVVRKNPSATGGVSVPLEFAPGAYVVEIQGTWQTPCLNLESSTAVSVDRG